MLLFVDQLTNVDFSYLDEERGLVGETWLASIEMEGELDSQGMICDFGIVKQRIKSWLDKFLDHRLLVPEKSSALELLSSEGEYSIRWGTQRGDIHCTSPCSAITLVPYTAITPGEVAQWSIGQLQGHFPNTVKSLTLKFTLEDIDGPFYHYSHGLKKHMGNCQRIAHGHRSKILIWRDGELSNSDMLNWSKKWHDIYIGSREDLINTNDSQQICSFKYTAQQGDFYLSLPTDLCYLIDTDSTVELIAKHVAECLASENPGHHFRVKAFEGAGKGAIVEATGK